MTNVFSLSPISLIATQINWYRDREWQVTISAHNKWNWVIDSRLLLDKTHTYTHSSHKVYNKRVNERITEKWSDWPSSREYKNFAPGIAVPTADVFRRPTLSRYCELCSFLSKQLNEVCPRCNYRCLHHMRRLQWLNTLYSMYQSSNQ